MGRKLKLKKNKIMGTRNMTMVINKQGEKKVAQYGQWDGYPSGVGVGVLNFLKNKELVSKLIDNLEKVRFLDPEGKDKDFIESYDKNTPQWSNEPDNRTDEQKRWWSTYCNRDLADDVLTNIANSTDKEIVLMNRENTAKGSESWVEWCYVINFQENKLVVTGRLDEDPIKSYSLDDLPTNEVFCSDLEPVEEN